MTVLVIAGTGTGIGKTVVTAAVAATALGALHRVAVLKPAQTGVAAGEPGDADEVRRLAGELTTREVRRYAEPLAPDTAARRSGIPPVRPAEAAAVAVELARQHDLVLIEGAGGLLVRLDADGGTVADVAWSLGASVLVVAEAGLGTLNATALTTEVLARRGLTCAGVVIGSWPADPDLAARCNVEDLPAVSGVPLVGVLPAGAGALSPQEFRRAAPTWLAASLGGEFSHKDFVDQLARGR